MAQLIVRLHGEEIARLELSEGHEYLAGRAGDADLVLPQQKGISRHHLKFYQQNGVWIVSLLARFGSLIRQGQESETLELTEDCAFSAPPFEFTFSLQGARSEPASPGAAVEDTRFPTIRDATTPHPQQEVEEPPKTNTAIQAFSEVTSHGQTPSLLPYLRIVYRHGKEDVLRLEGRHWVAGRDSQCEVQLEVSRASRRHFEISHNKDGYFVTDLNSANGTSLNNGKLTPNHPTPLNSGDVIKVASAKIYFELRNPNFAQNLPMLMPQPMADGLAPDQLPGIYAAGGHGGPGVVKLDPQDRAAEKKRKIVRSAIAIVVLIGVYKFFDSEPVEGPTGAIENASTAPNFEQMTPEKKQMVKNSFNLAMNMYMQTKYELCIAEIKKLHEIVPSYENSRELLTFCEHGSELQRKKEDADRREREQAESERAILKIVEDCKETVTEKSTMDDLRVCLAPAIERSPEHPAVNELFSLVKMHEDQRIMKEQSDAARRQHRAQGLRQLEKAKALYRSGQLAKSLEAYEKFLSGDYGLNPEQTQAAQRELAQARKELGTKVASLLQTCRESYEKSQYKAAYQACANVLKEDASNAEAEKLKASAMEDLKREMKSLYEDSVLEESMGNIDTAKERWKQIMEKAIPGDEYHGRAKRNLQKYGAGP